MGKISVILSIIIPVYNVEQYVHACLSSISNQINGIESTTEIIVVNDGSNDNSLSIINDWKKVHPELKCTIISQVNKGLASARNVGINKASGEFMLFLDSDDYIASNSLLEIHTYLSNNTTLDVVLGEVAYCILGNNNVPLRRNPYKRYIPSALLNATMGQKALVLLYNQCAFHISACLNFYRKKFVIENNLYFNEDLLVNEDDDWTLRVFLQANSVICSKILWYVRRYRSASITQTLTKKHFNSFRLLCELTRCYCNTYKDNSEVYNVLCNKMADLLFESLYAAYYFDDQDRRGAQICVKQNKKLIYKTNYKNIIKYEIFSFGGIGFYHALLSMLRAQKVIKVA